MELIKSRINFDVRSFSLTAIAPVPHLPELRGRQGILGQVLNILRLKYVEDLRRGPNADTCPPPADRTKRLF
jgi:hypothetical protein